MLRRLLSLFRGRPSADQVIPYPDGKRIYREFHSLRKEQMDPDALKVINRLSRHGYRSYLVGGCVRDMVLGKKPKDFDVVTQATPSQIRRIFANSRTIGRRFKIVHVVFRGGKIVEVSTFRGLPGHRLEGKRKNQDLLMKKDNVFGTPKEDAARRDFTINALYFDPRNESIIDYVGGFDDIQARNLRVIGDPEVSFEEDPVRMFRAAKFAALLNFNLEAESLKGIRKKKDEMLKASSARMLEEYYKIFRTGKTFEIFRSLAETGLLSVLFPFLGKVDGEEFRVSPAGRRLDIADKILTEREDLTTVIYLALLLAELVPDIFHGGTKTNIAEYVKNKISAECTRLNIPGKERDRLTQIFVSQPRFQQSERGRGNRPDVFRSKIFFYEAFIIFKIHALSRGDDDAIQQAMFWEFGPKIHPPSDSTLITMFPRRHRDRFGRPDRNDRPRDRDRGRDRNRDMEPIRDDGIMSGKVRPERPRPERPERDRNEDRQDRPERPDRNRNEERVDRDRNDRFDRNRADKSESPDESGARSTDRADRPHDPDAVATGDQPPRRRRRRFRRRRGPRNGNGGGNVTAENAENGDSGNPGSGNSPTTESGESFRESAEP